MLSSYIWPSRDSDWKQIWSSTERWRLKFRFLNYWYICSNVGPESKWCYPGGVSEQSEDRRCLRRNHSKSHSRLSQGKRHPKEGWEEATFRRSLGEQASTLLKKPKAKNNKEEKCFSNVRGERWRLELLLACSLRDCGLPEQEKELCFLYHIPRIYLTPCLEQRMHLIAVWFNGRMRRSRCRMPQKSQLHVLVGGCRWPFL